MRFVEFVILLVMATVAYFAPPFIVWAGDSLKGAYIFNAAGCANCHTDPGKKGKGARPKGEPLAGGRPLKTPFGTFYTPNITSSDAGMGTWSFADFQRAMIKGVAPNGAPYYPAFPYTSYTGMTTKDLNDLWTYLKSQKASDRVNQSHELKSPFNIRALMHGWRLLFFTPGDVGNLEPEMPTEWQRGAYLVRVLAHCGECHTPRNAMGAMNRSQELSGNPEGPGGEIPDLSPGNKKGVVTWSREEVFEYLSSGMTPEGDFAGGEMAEVIDHSTSILTEGDLTAIVVFVKSLK
jgi:mono/diheme cytochrome c family protein